MCVFVCAFGFWVFEDGLVCLFVVVCSCFVAFVCLIGLCHGLQREDM